MNLTHKMHKTQVSKRKYKMLELPKNQSLEVIQGGMNASPVSNTLQGTLHTQCNALEVSASLKKGYSIDEVAEILSIARRTAFKYASEVLEVWSWLGEAEFRNAGIYTEFALTELKHRKSFARLDDYRQAVHAENADRLQQPAPETPTASDLKATSALMKIAASSSPFSGLAIQAKPTEKVEALTVELQKTEAQIDADFAAFMELTAEIINQDEAAELADDLEFQQLRKQNAAKWLKRKAVLENDKQQILQGNLTSPKQPGNAPVAVSRL